MLATKQCVKYEDCIWNKIMQNKFLENKQLFIIATTANIKKFITFDLVFVFS